MGLISFSLQFWVPLGGTIFGYSLGQKKTDFSQGGDQTGQRHPALPSSVRLAGAEPAPRSIPRGDAGVSKLLRLGLVWRGHSLPCPALCFPSCWEQPGSGPVADHERVCSNARSHHSHGAGWKDTAQAPCQTKPIPAVWEESRICHCAALRGLQLAAALCSCSCFHKQVQESPRAGRN